MEQRLQKKDIRFLCICLLITAVSLAVGIPYFYQAFPEASIDFRITREQAGEQATSFLTSRGIDPAGYRHSAIFDYDDRTKTFLEKELGLEEANALIGDPVRLWRWSNRWVRELEKEEFRVEITTTGELVGFQHIVEEEAEGARLSEIEARYLAEQFLIDVLQRPLNTLEFVEATAVERPNRTDHTFTWKLVGFDVAGASYRLRVGIQGDRIGGFAEFLKVPEAWQRSYDELRSHNEATGLIAGFFLLLTLLAMLVTFFVSLRQQDIRWKVAILFGGIAFVLTLLANLNNLPVTEFNYDTTDTFGSFLTQQLLQSLLSALGQGIFILFLTAAAEPVYRRSYGGQIRIGEQFQPHGLQTKRFLLGAVLGLTMTAFFFAYQTFFYLIAEKFGAWSPTQIPYDEMVNTYIPWIMVLLVGFMPAVSEEFISRAFSIPFFQRYMKSRWAAVVLSAFIWGFAHASYPQQPFFIRGLEVGIAGVIIGFVMVRWGILAPLVWHYTVDALYTALILLRSSNSYFVVSAAVSAGIMLLPLAVALFLYLRRRYFIDSSSMLNSADSPPLEQARRPEDQDASPEAQLLKGIPDTPLAGCQSLTWRRLGIAAVLVALSLGFFALDVKKPLDFVDYAITADQAEQRAIEQVRRLGADPDTFSTVTFQHHQPDGNAIKYILQRSDVERVNRYYREDLSASLWLTRFFLPGQKEEYRVAVDPMDGSIYSVRHLLAEETPGADLEEEEARRVAEDHLRAHQLDPATFELKEASSEKLEARRDYRFVWEAREDDPRNLDELRYRVEVRIAGDQPVGLVRHFKLPEAWLREREESDTLQTVLRGTRIALIVAVVLHLLWLLIRQVRGQGLAWEPLVKLGLLAGLIALVGYLNSLPILDQAYDTRLTPAIFTVMRTVGFIIVLIGVSLVTTGGLGVISTLYPDWPSRLRASCRPPVLRDALIVALLTLVAARSLVQLTGWIATEFAAHLPSPTASLVSGLDTWWPLWNGLSSALGSALTLPILLGVAAYYAHRFLKRRLYAALLLILLGLLSAGGQAHDSGEFLLSFSLYLIDLAFVLVGVFYLLRNNLLAYILFGFLASGLNYVEKLLSLSAPAYRYNGYALFILLLLTIPFFLFQVRRRASMDPGR